MKRSRRGKVARDLVQRALTVQRLRNGLSWSPAGYEQALARAKRKHNPVTVRNYPIQSLNFSMEVRKKAITQQLESECIKVEETFAGDMVIHHANPTDVEHILFLSQDQHITMHDDKSLFGLDETYALRGD